MKTSTFVLILMMSLVLNTNAYRLRSKMALREQLLDYLLQAEDQKLMHERQTELKEPLEQYKKNFLDQDESHGDRDYERTHARRKAVGLGDDPFK